VVLFQKMTENELTGTESWPSISVRSILAIPNVAQPQRKRNPAA
jgi:hypothetical protein